MFNPVAWLVWLVAILTALSATRNPFYLALILLWLALLMAALPAEADTPPAPVSPLKFALIVVALSALFNGATVHVGSTALFNLPRTWPVIGGPFTLEALAYGVLNGLVLAGMFAAFIILNRVLPTRALVQLIPRAFYPVAVVVSIAVTFVPTTLRQFQQIREAQAVRGHRLRGLRDWLPLLIPLLVGGLERALQLAEAMTARGFAAGGAETHPTVTRAVTIAGLLAVLGGWLLRLVWGQPGWGAALLLVGVGLVAGALWQAGRRIPHTVYRPRRWTPRDWGMALCALLAAAAFLLPLPGLNRESIFYYPYPRLILPDFNLAIGLATAGLAVPALWRSGGKQT